MSYLRLRMRMGAGFRVFCATAALFAAGCSDVSEAPEAQAPEVLSPGVFSITPRGEAVGKERFDPDTGSLDRLGLPIRAHIAKAWGLRSIDLHFQIELPSGPFDVRVRPVEGGRDAAEALIRGGLSEYFGLVVEKGIWQGDTLALHVALGSEVSEAAEANSAEASEPVRRIGEYRVASVSISDFVDFLRRTTSTPIVDATGLEGKYDFALTWNTAQGGPALRAALSDAGFELRRERGVLDRWMVRKAQ